MRLNNDMIIECEECKNKMILFGNEIEFEVTSVEERGMGEEIGYEACEERDCQYCGNEIIIKISIYEYPIGVLNYDEHSVAGGQFIVPPVINYSLLPIDIELYDLYKDEQNYSKTLRSIIKEIKSKKKEFKDLSAEEFEDFVKEYFEAKEFVVEKTQQTRDGGKDLIARIDCNGIPFIIYIECKHHKKKIGIEYVRALYGVQNMEGVNKAILVTSSSFTKDAIKFAKETKFLIDLIDGETILEDIL